MEAQASQPRVLGPQAVDVDCAAFRRDGFFVKTSAVDLQFIDDATLGLEDAFEGRFETSAYPDSWLWQKGTSLEHLPRQMVNAWKCSLRVARLVVSRDIARDACKLMGWQSARLAADSIWFKPPNWRAGGYHRDEMDVFSPADLITCWVALDDMKAENGSLHYAVGSHLWTSLPDDDVDINIGDRPQENLVQIAERQGISATFRSVVAPKGSVSFHHGRTWHGTTPNVTSTWRRALGIHLIRSDACFASAKGGHVLGRYKVSGSDRLDENFFPIVWRDGGTRSSFLDDYCERGYRG